MQATLVWACAVAPKRLRRFAHAQNDLVWTAADATEFDLAAAPNSGYSRCSCPSSLRQWLDALPRQVAHAAGFSIRLALPVARWSRSRCARG